ncbi:MAG: hypothetical protein ACP5RE_03830 [Candidatus Acidifodinimicrobium sp.]
MFYYNQKFRMALAIQWKYLKKEEIYRIFYKISRTMSDGKILTYHGVEESDPEGWKQKKKMLLTVDPDGKARSVYPSITNSSASFSVNLGYHFNILMEGESYDAVSVLAGEINNSWRENLEKTSPGMTDIFMNTVKVISYGPASGMDISVGSETRKFRLHDEDFISSKNFKIWYTSEFGRVPDIADSEWKELVESWMSIAERKTSIEDDLVPSIWEDFTETLRMNTIYDEFSLDLLENLKTSNISEFVLNNNVLYVYNRIYEHLKTKFDVKARKLREYFLPFLIEASTKVIHRGQWQGRFWLLDWRKLTDRFPAIKEFEAKVVHIEETEQPEQGDDFDIRCRKCGKSIFLDPEKPSLEDEFIAEHIKIHGLKEPESSSPKEYAQFLQENFEFFNPDKIVMKKEASI